MGNSGGEIVKKLVITPSLCIGCGNCPKACTFSHNQDLDITRARIVVLKENKRAEKGIPVTCLQCEEAACLAVCPSGALVRNEEYGYVEYLEGRCHECLACVAACPFGNMRVDPRTRKPIKCNLCDGQPLCAVFCPTGAITYK